MPIGGCGTSKQIISKMQIFKIVAYQLLGEWVAGQLADKATGQQANPAMPQLVDEATGQLIELNGG